MTRLTLKISATSPAVSTSSRSVVGVPSWSWVTPSKLENTQLPVNYLVFHKGLWKAKETPTIPSMALTDVPDTWVPQDSFAARLVGEPDAAGGDE